MQGAESVFGSLDGFALPRRLGGFNVARLEAEPGEAGGDMEGVETA